MSKVKQVELYSGHYADGGLLVPADSEATIKRKGRPQWFAVFLRYESWELKLWATASYSSLAREIGNNEARGRKVECFDHIVEG